MHHDKDRALTAIDRRTLLKSSAAAGAALATGLAMPAIAQTRAIKLGYVSPQTGPLAAFAEADNFIIANFKEADQGAASRSATPPCRSKSCVKDSQSNPNRAAEVAKDLIVQDKIDLMLVASTPETTNPVSTQCEIEEVPCISTVAPWQPWFIGRQANPAAVRRPGRPSTTPITSSGASRTSSRSSPTCGARSRPTNRSAACSPTTATAMPGATSRSASRRCWRRAATSSPTPAATRTSPTISRRRSARSRAPTAEIVTGVVLPPDFTTFWKQALQQGFKPKVASIGKAILFPVAVEALGKDGNNLSSEVWWSPSHPFKSSLTGMSAKELADAYEAATKKQWTQPIGFVHALFEVAVDVLKRAPERDAKATVAAIAATNLDTVVGKVQWNGANLPPFAAKNVAKTPLVGGQWRVKDGNKYDIVITDNRTAPDIPVGGKMEPIA